MRSLSGNDDLETQKQRNDTTRCRIKERHQYNNDMCRTHLKHPPSLWRRDLVLLSRLFLEFMLRRLILLHQCRLLISLIRQRLAFFPSISRFLISEQPALPCGTAFNGFDSGRLVPCHGCGFEPDYCDG